MIKKLKELNKKHQAWVKGNGYKFSKPLMYGFFLLALVLLGVVAFVDGVDEKVFVECDSPMSCSNPLALLDDCDHYCCELDFLPAGSSCGESVSWLGRNYSFLVVLGFIVLLLFNHFLFNRGYDFNKYWGEWK